MSVLDKQARIQVRWVLILTVVMFAVGIVTGTVWSKDAGVAIAIALGSWLGVVGAAWWKTEAQE